MEIEHAQDRKAHIPGEEKHFFYAGNGVEVFHTELHQWFGFFQASDSRELTSTSIPKNVNSLAYSPELITQTTPGEDP